MKRMLPAIHYANSDDDYIREIQTCTRVTLIDKKILLQFDPAAWRKGYSGKSCN